jgi:hypothetical protein
MSSCSDDFRDIIGISELVAGRDVDVFWMRVFPENEVKLAMLSFLAPYHAVAETQSIYIHISALNYSVSPKDNVL